MTRILSLLLILCPLSLIAGGGHSKSSSLPPLHVQVALLTMAENKKISSDEASYLPDRKKKEYSINRAPKDATANGEHTIKIIRADFNQKEKKATIRYQTTTASQPPENGEAVAAYGHTSERTELATTPPLYVMASVLYLSNKDS
jgi:hypothetical protein